jgi:hypothetical protein
MSRGQREVIKTTVTRHSVMPFALNGSSPDIKHIESAMMCGHIVLTQSGWTCERSHDTAAMSTRVIESHKRLAPEGRAQHDQSNNVN